MAIAIKSIPVLKNKEAERFLLSEEKARSRKATVDFSEQIKSANRILTKANMK